MEKHIIIPEELGVITNTVLVVGASGAFKKCLEEEITRRVNDRNFDIIRVERKDVKPRVGLPQH